jgi:hypothetical protein
MSRYINVQLLDEQTQEPAEYFVLEVQDYDTFEEGVELAQRVVDAWYGGVVIGQTEWNYTAEFTGECDFPHWKLVEILG